MIDPGMTGDVFNARDISPQELSDGFIASPEFSRLLSHSHCVLEGPRGSGKTTLLRMLTPEAFARWSINQGDRPTIKFIGIFVPADIRWAKQLETRLRKADPDTKGLIEQTAFSISINLSLINTLEQCSRFSNQYSASHPDLFFAIGRDKEGEIVEACAQLWGLDVSVPSFNAIRLALRMRQHALGQLTLSPIIEKAPADIVQAYPFLGSTWLENIVTAVETINDILDRRGQVWAMLLDELEIIPESLLKTIVVAFRSTSALVRFKVALSPTGSQLIQSGEDGAPTPNNDYREIRLWYPEWKDCRHFTETLFRASLVRYGLISAQDELSELFSPSTIEDDDGLDLGDHATSSVELLAVRNKELAHRERVKAFVSLYAKDTSFKKILDERQIDPSDPPYKDGAPHGVFVRKITPIAVFRDREIERFDYDHGVRKKGARRGFGPYFGYPKLLQLTEGNPRWILTLAEALRAEGKNRDSDIWQPSVQTPTIEGFTRSFISKLKVYPTTGSQWTAFEFVAALGAHLQEALYGGAFTTDPSLSFKIDQWALDNYGSFVRVCIDLGALVIMRGEPSATLTSGSDGQSLLGSRVRISWRLAPEFRIPLKATKEQAMSSALKTNQSPSALLEKPAQGRLSL